MESFNRKPRYKLIIGELFLTLTQGRLDYTYCWYHVSWSWMPPAAYAETLDDSKDGIFPDGSATSLLSV